MNEGSADSIRCHSTQIPDEGGKGSELCERLYQFKRKNESILKPFKDINSLCDLVKNLEWVNQI